MMKKRSKSYVSDINKIVEKLGFMSLEDALSCIYDDKKSTIVLSYLFGRSPVTMRTWLKEYNISLRGRGGSNHYKTDVYKINSKIFIYYRGHEGFNRIICTKCYRIVWGGICDSKVKDILKSHICEGGFNMRVVEIPFIIDFSSENKILFCSFLNNQLDKNIFLGKLMFSFEYEFYIPVEPDMDDMDNGFVEFGKAMTRAGHNKHPALCELVKFIDGCFVSVFDFLDQSKIFNIKAQKIYSFLPMTRVIVKWK